MKQLEKILKGLANSRRLMIIRVLAKEKELPVTEIAGRIKLSFTSTSKHLLLLYKLDILDRRQDKLVVYYRLADKLPFIVKQVLLTFSNSRE
jgi:DNA-binding transcriptional ArsR family regulator